MKVPDLLPVARSGYSHLSPRTPFRRSGQLATIQPALPWFHNLANHMAGRVLLFGKKQSPLSGDSFEWLLTIIDEPQVRSFNQVLDGMRDQYLVSLVHRSDQRANMKRDTRQRTVQPFAFPRMQPGANV